MTIKYDDPDVSWLDYATVRVESPDDFAAYFNPGCYGVLDDYYARDGDLVLATHNHHYDSDAIERVTDADATAVAFEGADVVTIDRDVVPVEDLPYGMVRMDEEAHLIVGEVDVWSLPAFNDPDGLHLRDGDAVHPQGLGCGSYISIADRAVSWPGDSDVLEDHKHLEVSLLLANVSGSIVMDRREAADFAEMLDPDLALPIHCDTIPLPETDPDAPIVDMASRGIPVVLDDPDQVRGDDGGTDSRADK